MAEVILLNSSFFSNLCKKLNFSDLFKFSNKIFENFKRSWWLNKTELTKCNNIWSYIRYRVPPSVVALKVSYGSVINFFFEILKNLKILKNSIFLKNSKRFHHALFKFFKDFEFFRIFKFFKIFQNFKKKLMTDP